MSLEVLIGRRVVPLVGALAVLLAVGFLVKYAFDIGFFGQLPPAARFGAGVAIGVILLVGGEFVRRRGAPGAAVGLDAAGLGSLLVSAVIGVYGLELFGKGAGALVACGAGLFGVLWSLRTQSIVVGAIALLALFGAPVGFDQFRESALLAGLQLTLAIGAGCTMHVVGPSRFEALRFLAVVLGFALGGVVVASAPSPAMSSGFVALWWASFAAGASICAIRGRARGANEAVLLLTSVAVLAAHLPLWMFGTVFGLGALSNPVAWLAVLVGAALAAQSGFLRSFDVSGVARVSAADASDPESVAGLAASRACASLASFAEPLAAVLLLSGLAVFVDVRAVAPMFAAGALLCAWIASKRSSPASRLGLEIVAPIAVVPTVLAALRSMQWGAFGGAAAAAKLSIPLPRSSALELHATPAIGVVVALAGLLFAAPVFGLRRLPSIALCVLAALLWIAAAIACSTTGPGFLLVLAVPALALGAWQAAPAMSAWTGIAIALVASAGVGIRAIYAVGAGAGETGSGDVVVLALASASASSALELGAVRSIFAGFRMQALTAAHVVSGALVVALVAAGARLGDVGASHPGLVVVLACAVVSLVLLAMAMGLRRLEIAIAGLGIGALGVLGGTVAGLLVLFTRVPADTAGAAGLSAATAVMVLVVLAGATAVTRAFGVPAAFVAATQAIAGVALVPVGALLVSSVVGEAIAAPVAAGWIIAVGVTELVVGFRRQIAPLRWAGLAAFTLLVLRLYAVDLAGTPLLVRVALLFVSGMVLVATGIVYARGIGVRRNARGEREGQGEGQGQVQGQVQGRVQGRVQGQDEGEASGQGQDGPPGG